MVPACAFELGGERSLAGVAASDIEGSAAEDGDVGGAVVAAVARGVLAQRHVELPVQSVLDVPVRAHGVEQRLRGKLARERKDAHIGLDLAVDRSRRLDASERLQARK